MEIDCPIISLKRSSSAPMIHEISAAVSVSSSSTSTSRDVATTVSLSPTIPRTRRFSTSSFANTPRLTPRVNQLKQEECIDVAGREAAHEKEIHSVMQISQSWEDLTLEAEGLSFKDSELPNQQLKNIEKQMIKRVVDPLNLNLPIINSSPPCSSPSPTRSSLGQRQCYSPRLHIVHWRNNLSPSPTRKPFAMRRSLSPIAIRPSCLGPVKRKFDLTDNSTDRQQPLKRASAVLSNPSRSDKISNIIPGTINLMESSASFPNINSSDFSFHQVEKPTSNRVIINDNERITRNTEQAKITRSKQRDQMNKNNYR
ncbi:P2R1A-PPP2R2A-interacting phosphatase regulator 1 [Microplitis demolitor]|uniref:P2R1A-PPP2R2A-interacting phosphatase regulator 1 n=1 Tax=Microplitis demolitor TaxID=69319 RepID=UPI0004CCB3FA|nr:P2R1A-PPP2R2A-interacting phosphatase regulator 1 [Microplitis demolitor]XP_014298130.1 P2R1A-PPP2R2A-interacting phosphatase regulator 1 [Microplitis demolitor]XP_053596359.1 P2R1A-PPP2R2A-interacting phosphatase regulator 1 [Microplitis demolitor]